MLLGLLTNLDLPILRPPFPKLRMESRISDGCDVSGEQNDKKPRGLVICLAGTMFAEKNPEGSLVIPLRDVRINWSEKELDRIQRLTQNAHIN